MNPTSGGCWGVLALFLIGFPVPALAQESFVESYAETIEAFLDEKFTDNNAGMVIGLIDEHGSRVFSLGRLDNGTDAQVNGDTIFELGSVTKVFTSLLLLDAVRRGEMNLDDPVSKHLPEGVTIPTYEGKEITLVHLAAQESGLPFHPDRMQALLKEKNTRKEFAKLREAANAYTVEDLLKFVSGYKLPTAPGAGFQYSNVGMALLGHALERRTEQDYEALVVDRIAAPLGMHSTRITLTPKLKARLARGHWLDGDPSEHVQFQAMRPSGSLLSTGNDLIKFVSASFGFSKSHLTPLMRQSFVVRHRDHPRFGKTAMPWFDERVYNPPGTEILAHGGGGFGNLAFMGVDLNKRRGVVVLTNQMNVSPYNVGWTLLQGLPLTPESVTFGVREVVGLGIALNADEKSGTIEISRVFPKSPAGQAGLTEGLVIRSVNGVSVEGKSVQECLELLGGPRGGVVRLELFDPETKATRIQELVREKFLTAGGTPFKRKLKNAEP